MLHCHNCGEEIRNGMKFCPHCGQDQAVVVPRDQRIPTEEVEDVPPPPSASDRQLRSPTYAPAGSPTGSPVGGPSRKWWLIGLLGCGGVGLLFVALVVVAIVSGASSNTAQGGGGQESGGGDEKSGAKGKGGADGATVAVREPAELDDRTFAVTEVEGDYAPRNRYSKAGSGEEYLRVLVSLTNTSNRPIDYNPFDFKVEDSNGVQEGPTFMSEVPYNLEAGSLAPDGNMEGNMIFEVPRNDDNLKLIYTTNVFSGETVTVEPLR